MRRFLPLLLILGIVTACAGEATPTPATGGTTPTAAATQPGGAAGGSTAMGQELFNSKGCTACHTIQGVPGASGEIGPELTHVGTAAATRKPGMTAEAYIRESILTPDAFIVEGYSNQMPQLVQAGADLNELVQFLLAQK